MLRLSHFFCCVCGGRLGLGSASLSWLFYNYRAAASLFFFKFDFVHEKQPPSMCEYYLLLSCPQASSKRDVGESG